MKFGTIMRKRVLFLYHTSTVGGGSYCLLNILKHLDRKQIIPYVLLRSQGPLVNEIEKLDIEVRFLSSLRTVPYNSSTLKFSALGNAIRILQSMNELNKLIYQMRIDIVYCNTMMLYPYLRIAKYCGCKTIIHIREHWPDNEHIWQRKIALRHIANYADEIIAINRYSAAMVKPFNRIATIVYDWIDMSTRYEYMPLSSIFSEDMSDKKVYMYMGGLQEIKGALQVINAFTNHIQDSNSRLLVLGIDPNYRSYGLKGFVKKCLKFINRESYSDKVVRMINSDSRIKCINGVYNIRHLYEQAHCVISYFTIPHANLALAECIICNTINVAAVTDESLEYSAEGKLAILYEENNFEEFINSIKSVDTQYFILKESMAKSSYIIKQMFAPDKNIHKLNTIIEKLYENDIVS